MNDDTPQADTSRPRRKGCCLATVLVLLLIALLLALPRLIPRPAVPAIPNPFREVPEAQNAWPALAKAAATIAEPTDWTAVTSFGTTPGAPNPVLTPWIKDNAGPLQSIDQALARPELVMPRTDPDTAVTMPGLAGVRNVARLLAARGNAKLLAGDRQGALRDYQQTVRLGQRVAEGSSSLIGYMVGEAVRMIGLRAMRAALGTSGWTAADRAAWRAAIDQLPDWDALGRGLRHALAAEFYLRRDGYLDLEHSSPGTPMRRVPSLFYDREQTVSLVQARTVALMHQAEHPRWEREPSPPLPGGTPGIRSSITYNSIGKTLIAISAGVDEKLVDKLDQDAAWCRITAAHIAIRLFELDHHRLPKDWHELVGAGLLKQVPLDPFDGQPLRYEPGKGLVYAVGPNLKDDGGARSSSSGGADDIGEALHFIAAGTPPAQP